MKPILKINETEEEDSGNVQQKINVVKPITVVYICGLCDFFCKRKNSYNIERFCK